MSLPIRTTIADVTGLCGYLSTKPIGATVAEAKAVLDSAVLDGRKLNAMKFWGLIEENQDTGRLKLTECGRTLAKNKFAQLAEQMRIVIKRVPAYMAIIERSNYIKEYTISSSEVAAHWRSHFAEDSSESEKILNDQAVCFFHVAEAADLGELTVGRAGHPTRFKFAEGKLSAILDDVADLDSSASNILTGRDIASSADDTIIEVRKHEPASNAQRHISRVFITHGKNTKILQQVKDIVVYGGFEPVVTMERETAAKPVPEKVLNDMRNCEAAVIHVAVDGIIIDQDGRGHPQINGNVLIEIGAAMGLYRGYKFILLVEEGLVLPSNLQGLYECRYSGDELSSSATMKLLKAFNEFKSAA